MPAIRSLTPPDIATAPTSVPSMAADGRWMALSSPPWEAPASTHYHPHHLPHCRRESPWTRTVASLGGTAIVVVVGSVAATWNLRDGPAWRSMGGQGQSGADSLWSDDATEDTATTTTTRRKEEEDMMAEDDTDWYLFPEWTSSRGVLFSLAVLYCGLVCVIHLVACYKFVAAWNQIAAARREETSIVVASLRRRTSSTSSTSTTNHTSTHDTLNSSHVSTTTTTTTKTNSDETVPMVAVTRYTPTRLPDPSPTRMGAAVAATAAATAIPINRNHSSSTMNVSPSVTATCPICVVDLVPGEWVATCPPPPTGGCGTVFHRACLATWLDGASLDTAASAARDDGVTNELHQLLQLLPQQPHEATPLEASLPSPRSARRSCPCCRTAMLGVATVDHMDGDESSWTGMAQAAVARASVSTWMTQRWNFWGCYTR